jgi:hypothetical protein
VVDEPRETKAQKREAARKRRLEEQRRRARARRRKRAIMAAVAAIVVLALGVVGFQAIQRSGAKVTAAEKEAGCGRITQQKDAGSQHIDVANPPPRRDYTSKPPTSGDHYGNFVPPIDFYETNTMRPEQYVHGLEHGYVIVHHKGLPKDQVEELRRIQAEHDQSLIVLPNEEIERSVILTAWRYIQSCDRVSALVIGNFIEQRCNKGPEKLTKKC